MVFSILAYFNLYEFLSNQYLVFTESMVIVSADLRISIPLVTLSGHFSILFRKSFAALSYDFTRLTMISSRGFDSFAFTRKAPASDFKVVESESVSADSC